MSGRGGASHEDRDVRLVGEPEPLPSAVGPAPAVSQRALALVAAFSVAQRNASQAMHAGLDEQFRVAKAEHVRAYHALLGYVAELEETRSPPAED